MNETIKLQKKCEHNWEKYESPIIEIDEQLYKCSKCQGITLYCPQCRTFMKSDHFLLALQKFECKNCYFQIGFKSVYYFHLAF